MELTTKTEDLKLLPETHDFFDTQTSLAIPVFIYTTIALLAAVIIWMLFAKMDDVVKASAILRPTENISEMKCLSSGEITEKLYSQNQKVRQGDLLLKIDCTSEQAELLTLQSQLEKYENELNDDRLFVGIIEGNESAGTVSLQLKNRLDSYLFESKKMELQIDDFKRKYEAEENMPESMKTRQKITESKSQLEQTEFAYSSWKQSQIIQLNEEIKSYEEKIQSVKLRKTVLERTVKNANLYAPIDGIVDEVLALNVGDYVLSGSDILRIVPDENERLKAEVVMDASKIARVKVGQEIKLRFQGLPPSSFGQLKGRVSLIPADITVSSNNPVFIVECEILEPYLYSKSGDRINLRSGLSAEARIIISRDSVMKMILRKLDFIN